MTKNRPRRLINAKLEQKKAQNMRTKTSNAERTFQSKWLADFCQLRLDADSVSYRHICRKYPAFADQKS
jgi:hypothetical protein